MNEITIITFNYGNAGRYVNGPGMCLVSFVESLRSSGLKVNVFSKLKSYYQNVMDLKNTAELKRAIRRSMVVHHWSGMGREFERAILIAQESPDSCVLVGPNVIDTVEFKRERSFLNSVKFDKLLAVNERLKFRISKLHSISLSKIEVIKVGPNLKLWSPTRECDDTILWKGNSKHPVKDINFALKLRERLPEYKFKFIGYPKPYNYLNHIKDAKKSKLLIVTSLNETMCLSMMEAWASGVPSISHPKIYMHGENYRTGIITNKTPEDYSEAINEVMSDASLYKKLSLGASSYMAENFSADVTSKKYLGIIRKIQGK